MESKRKEPTMNVSKYLPSDSVVTLCITVINVVITTLSLIMLPYVTHVSNVASLMDCYRIYLHIGNVINVFGIIGVLRLQGSTMMAYAAWLFIDAVLSIIPRLVILWIVSSINLTLCTGAPVPFSMLLDHSAEGTGNGQIMEHNGDRAMSSCERKVEIAELATEVAFVGLMGLQLFAANVVRHFARKLSLSDTVETGDIEAGAGETRLTVGISEETKSEH